VPKGNLLTPASKQAILGGLFLLTFITWAWFAFVRPTTYSRYNAERFAQTLYRFVLKGSPDELAVIADELAYSARALVRHATERGGLGVRVATVQEVDLRRLGREWLSVWFSSEPDF